MTTKASEGQVSKEDVADYLASGDRTIALAAMRGEHRLITGDVIAESRSLQKRYGTVSRTARREGGLVLAATGYQAAGRAGS